MLAIAVSCPYRNYLIRDKGADAQSLAVPKHLCRPNPSPRTPRGYLPGPPSLPDLESIVSFGDGVIGIRMV